MIRTVLSKLGLAVTLFLLLGNSGLAQNNDEIGLLLGGSLIPNSSTSLNIGSGLAYEATYAHLFADNGTIGLGFEVPFVALPSQDVQSSSSSAPRNYASIFITPGIRIRFASNAAVAPWASVGGGYARFAESTTRVNGTPNTAQTGTNKGAVQFGGGADFKTPFHILLPLIFRGEIRDFYSGQPRLNVVRSERGQHNLIISGGIVLRF